MYGSLKGTFRSRRLLDSSRHSDDAVSALPSLSTSNADSTGAAPERTPTERSSLSSYAFRRRSEPSGSHRLSSASGSEPGLPLRSRDQDRKNEPLGLHVIYAPPGTPSIDLVLIHGLGGTSRMSWSHNKDLAYFWPQEWLPSEPGFKDARIMTFGYNAHFMSQAKDLFNISDFAKDLLLQLKTGTDENAEPLGVGQAPIVFVVHSMGGLVVKKAYILGSQDMQFKHILDMVCSIVFLATPHRGSNLAETLHKFLTVSFQSSKQYVIDLQKNSARISDINDQFQLHAQKLELVSFFETQPTFVGLKKMIVVEKDSAIMGYQNELSSPLNADHHTVIKFASRKDANYISVRNMLRSLVDKFKLKAPSRPRSIETDSLRSLPSTDELMARLNVEPRPTDTLASVMEQYAQGSCDWILHDPQFTAFMDNNASKPAVLHVTGGPGSGKTVMASFLAEQLESLGHASQLWYFRYNDQAQRSNRQCLLSLAFQVLASLPEYTHRLLSRAADIDTIARSDLRSVWQKLFLKLLDKINQPEPLYWIIDAVDESESPQSFLNLLASLKTVRYPLRLILTTRAHTVTKHFDRLRNLLPVGSITNLVLSTPRRSMQLFISETLNFTPWADDLKDKITESLLQKTQGSYLWLSLVMRELINCDTVEQVEEALSETPDELYATYSRIEESVAQDLRPADAPLLKAILSWVACSERRLNEEELKEALKPKFSVLNLRNTISRLCGDFVSVDKKGTISMVHHTAKDFLTRSATTMLRIDTREAHGLLLDKCLSILTDPRVRLRLKSQGCTGILRHCCLSWPHHMARSDPLAKGSFYINTITSVFSSPAILAWIEAVATVGQVHTLAKTAKALMSFTTQVKRMTADDNPMSHPLAALDLLSQWAVELVRILGKFGMHLVQCPGSIHEIIPLFCPPESLIASQFTSNRPLVPRITGISATTWDDSLAKFTVGQGGILPQEILLLNSYFGIISSDKCVILYDASTFSEVRKFKHDEMIVAAQFSSDEELLVTCGIRTIKVWHIHSGDLLLTYSNPLTDGMRRGMRAKAVAFSGDDSEIIIYCVDSTVRRQLLSEPEEWLPVEWQQVHGFVESGVKLGGGSPICLSFSPDGSKIVTAFRTAPMTVWDTLTGNRIGLCHSRGGNNITPTRNPDHANRLTWNPVTEHVVGTYQNGTVFKWDITVREVEEMQGRGILATEVACSADGRLLVTAHRDGSLKIFSYDNFTPLFNMRSAMQPAALAFSLDGRRIYDLRKSFCSVWEPNALIRVAEQDDSDADSSQFDASVTSSMGSEATAVILDPVSIVAIDPSGAAYAVGHKRGVVKYVTPQLADGQDIACGTDDVISLGFSGAGDVLAIATLSNRCMVRKILPGGLVDSGFVFCPGAMGSLLQIAVDSPGKHVLVHTQDATRVWDIGQQTLVATQAHDGESCYWTPHPRGGPGFLAIGPTSITYRHSTNGPAAGADESSVQGQTEWQMSKEMWNMDFEGLDAIDWSEMAQIRSRTTNWRHCRTESNSELVDKILTAPDGSVLLLELTTLDASATYSTRIGEIRMMLVDTSFLDSLNADSQPTDSSGQKPQNSRTIHPQALPAAILRLIVIPLGFMYENHDLARRGSAATVTNGARKRSEIALAFIDEDFWVRTWSLGDTDGTGSRRHFFLPRDWINMDYLGMAKVTADGRLFCPRNGEVAVIHNGLWGSLNAG